MVIRANDRVSTVIAQDEAVIDVFVSLSPAFERLRNAGMRKVMSRLVTVEQAARMAGVDAGELVSRLNSFLSGGRLEPVAGEVIEVSTDRMRERPAALAAVPDDRIVEVDVRDELRAGREPFSLIMAARRRVPEGGALTVRAIFEPVPLYAVLKRQGLDHWTEQLAADDWRVWFYPPAAGEAASAATAGDAAPEAAESARAAPAVSAEEDDVVVLDVRGLEPPEPMARTLAALEQLPVGGTLVQINVRTPQFLLPLLAERGFVYEVREQEPDLVRVFIRHSH
ncbi:MAG TPA: DUF2249 domain-containing protein [Longimicrobiales bacterium]